MPIFQTLTDRGFQVEVVSHAEAILLGDFPEAVAELEREVNKLNRDACIRYNLSIDAEHKVVELTAEIERLNQASTMTY